MVKGGHLYIVSTPIGNLGDITLRGIEVLRSVDAVVCEETREGSTLLKKLEITPKELIALNEHNETELAMSIIYRLQLNQSMAVISDCGTPVFADPGHFLIRQAVESGIPVVPIPGASSLMAALSVLDVKLERFVFGGFLPRDADQRKNELMRLRALKMPLVLMDTPYRLKTLLEEIVKVFGKGQKITVACDLTLPGEKIYRGSAADVLQQAGGRKSEFIMIVHL
jgi:16S rRNA (cytidine1402-2'-O)-methyltransferase